MDDSTALSPHTASPPWKLGLLSPPTTKPINSSSFSTQNAVLTTTPTTAPPPKLDLELLSLKGASESYTSLRDLLPSSAAVNSPTCVSAANSGYEISIRNRLVKQAAWAYLQPVSSSSGPSGPNWLRRLCLKLSSCLSFFSRHVIPLLRQAFRRTLLCLGLATHQ